MTETRGRVIYHLMPAGVWEQEASAAGPIAADQLERHGFVHCCTREQILEIAAWWLSGEAPLVVVAIDPATAGDVRFERADLGREYPHVYNALPRDAVVGIHRLDDLGALPPDLATPAPSFCLTGTREGHEVRVRWEGGRLVAGDEAVRAAAQDLAASGGSVPQFPGVSTRASLDTPYGAFCTLAALLDEVTAYRGDGFCEEGR